VIVGTFLIIALMITVKRYLIDKMLRKEYITKNGWEPLVKYNIIYTAWKARSLYFQKAITKLNLCNHIHLCLCFCPQPSILYPWSCSHEIAQSLRTKRNQAYFVKACFRSKHIITLDENKFENDCRSVYSAFMALSFFPPLMAKAIPNAARATDAITVCKNTTKLDLSFQKWLCLGTGMSLHACSHM